MSLITRFAPSPTGHLHLGHLVHILWVWATARDLKAKVIFRIEDHDQTRCKKEFEDSIVSNLEWLGLFNQDVPLHRTFRQTERGARYSTIAKELIARDLVYACKCSRKELESFYNPQTSEVCYPATCRDLKIPLDAPNVSWRIKLSNSSFKFKDLRLGELTQNPATTCGDMAIRDRNNLWTYQFCVVVDDIDQNINLIIRGEDLLSSVGRQLALRNLVLNNTAPKLEFLHHPLLLGEDDEKLSKSKHSEPIKNFIAHGVSKKELFELVKPLWPPSFSSF